MQRARFICARPGRCTAFLPCARGTRRANILTSSSMKRVAWEEKRARGAAPISIAGSERPVVRRENLTIRRGDRVKAVIQCAGKVACFRPHTFISPKPLMPIGRDLCSS
jgi:hypothetical protein